MSPKIKAPLVALIHKLESRPYFLLSARHRRLLKQARALVAENPSDALFVAAFKEMQREAQWPAG